MHKYKHYLKKELNSVDSVMDGVVGTRVKMVRFVFHLQMENFLGENRQ